MRTTQPLTYIYNPKGSFTLDEGQELREYETRLTVPKGQQVSHDTATGEDKNYHFVVGNDFADRYYHHDLTYRGINIPKKYISKS